MISVDILVSDFRSALGAPYVSPGSTYLNQIHAQGVDCSGLFVAAFRHQGGSIYHGSNSMWREYSTEKGSISNHGSNNGYPKNANPRKSTQLQVGMAVYKWQKTGCNSAKYEKDGQGNYCHVGLVVSVKPLQIIHASSEAGKIIIDTKIGKWCAWSWLKGIERIKKEVIEVREEEDVVKLPYMGRIDTKSGSLNVRSEPISGKVVGQFEKGEIVKVSAYLNGWAFCSAHELQGWCSGGYLLYDSPCEDAPDGVGVDLEQVDGTYEERLQAHTDQIGYILRVLYREGLIDGTDVPHVSPGVFDLM